MTNEEERDAEVADALRKWIDAQPIVKDEHGNPTIAPVYNAHVLLCELLRESIHNSPTQSSRPARRRR